MGFEGNRVSFRSLGKRLDPPAEAPRGASRVLAASPKLLFLDAPLKSSGEDFEIRVGDTVRRLRFAEDDEAALYEILAYSAGPSNDRYWAELAAVDEELDEFDDLDMDFTKVSPAAVALLEKRLLYAQPQDALDCGMPWIAVPRPDWTDPTRQVLRVRALYEGAGLGAEIEKGAVFEVKAT